MSLDLANLLNDWPYQPGQINVRLIEGDDHRPKIQLRVDLGLLQMEVSGRPDGVQPEGFESLLEQQETALDDHIADNGSAEGFLLEPDTCRALREEAVQYYHRYLSLLVLEDYEGVVRDTTRNLRVLDICAAYASAESDRMVMEQFRPYLLMMRARALASQAIDENEPKAALLAIDEALEAIARHFATEGDAVSGEFEEANEVRLLRGMKAALAPKLPVSAKEELRRRLSEAVATENYKLAAILRDELRSMPEKSEKQDKAE